MHKILKKTKNNIFFICSGIVLFLYAFSLVYMLGWALLTTLRPYSDFLNSPVSLPSKIDFSHWVKVIQNFCVPVSKNGVKIADYYIEDMAFFSILYAVGCALVQTTTACVCAYLTAKYPFRLGKIVYATVIVVMIIPVVGSLPSEIQTLKTLGLYDTLIGIYIMKMNFLGTYFLVFYATFKSLSWEYAESAFLDGASHLTVLLRIMLPLVRTSFLAVFILNFIVYWNDYQSPMLYLPSYPTMAYGLFYMRFANTQSFGSLSMQLTGCMMTAIPTLIIFVCFQKKLMGNLTVGGLKG